VVPGNLTDATSLALPFGYFSDGLPRSLQIMGPPGSEQAVLAAGEIITKLQLKK
jgi:Asp-tRNA(Asn)/Glu-tRNA(Gln) amidotransferase A subunit family amidase